VIGQDNVGMSALAVSLVFAGNAIAGVPSARYRGTRKLPGLWIMVTAACALLIGVFNEPAVFWIALTLWGFSFWMAVPGAFALLAERSRYPNERAGDAQAVMAAGRVVGPLVGGAAYALSPATLGIVGFVVIGVAALLMVYIEWRIHPSTFTDLVPA
jgi:MFS family permease